MSRDYGLSPPEYRTVRMKQNIRCEAKVMRCLLACAKKIEAISGLKAVDTFKEVIKAEIDKEFLLLIHNNSPGKDVVKLELRRTKGRPTGNCIENAFAEQRKTGNKVRWGYMTATILGRHIHNVIHVFNEDKDGKFYDTQDLPEHGMFDTLVSLQKSEYSFEAVKGLYDYYYIRTQGRTFKFRRPFDWDWDSDGYAFEHEIVVG